MKRATAWHRSRTAILQAASRTTMGLWIGEGPVVVIGEADFSHLGEAVLNALAGSREGVPHPTSWDGSFEPVLRAAGVKSWSKFVKSTKCVDIDFATNRVSFLPTRNAGAKDGFKFLETKALDCPPVEDELTKTLLAAFEACE